jgi:hypothetical protein
MARYNWRVCIPDLTPVPDQSDCPEAKRHTPSPSGYIARAEWAEKKEKTHTVEKCSGCGLYKVWKKKKRKKKKRERPAPTQ